MKYYFTESPMPKDLLAKRFDELMEESSGRVIFGYTQFDIEAKFTSSVKHCKISHEVYVRSIKDTKFKLPILRVSHGIMPYPVDVSFVDEILKDIPRKEKAEEWHTITLKSKEEYIAFLEQIISDKNFFSIISSIYNM